MDPIKEAFSRIKSDIQALKDEIRLLKQGLQAGNPSTNTPVISSETLQQTDTQTQNDLNGLKKVDVESLYNKNYGVSIGNKGVPTDRQTNEQTDRQKSEQDEIPPKDPISEFKRANEILSQLDEVKQEIRKKFKSLSNQEMRVFSVMYSLEDQKDTEITYRKIARILQLSESSIRDYVNKIRGKGILIEKIRQNNKTVYLKIASNITKIASLATIMQLREM